MRAVQCARFGGPEVLDLVEAPEPAAGDGLLLVEVSAAGVNFADTSRLAGTYQPTPSLPFIPGTEVVGRTADGRRVLASTFDGGGLAQRAVVAAADAVPVPDGVTDAQALALLVQGLTAWHILRNCARVRPGETVVVNAAAGGVGSPTRAVPSRTSWPAGPPARSYWTHSAGGEKPTGRHSRIST